MKIYHLIINASLRMQQTKKALSYRTPDLIPISRNYSYLFAQIIRSGSFMEERLTKIGFGTAFDSSFLLNMQPGVLSYTYKGVGCLKNPLDLALYSKLIWEMKPGTLIELGTYRGGSALWFADTVASFNYETKIISLDLIDYSEQRDKRVNYLIADVNKLGETLTPKLLELLPRPLLVIEDSAHTYEATLAVLNFFNEEMKQGDVIIIEDGVLDELGMSETFGGGPNRALSEFLRQNHGNFEIMTDYCDYYGRNATYNPNGYLRCLR